MTKPWFFRGALASALLVLALASAPARAQSSFTTVPRIAGEVEDSIRTRVDGNVSPVIHAAVDQGEADAGTQLNHMRLVLSRTTEQKEAFETYLAQLQDKSSPNYHKWLTPAQIGKLYGVADSDLATATAWLESHGLKVETVAPFRTDIPFSGTVAQVEEAFQVKIHSYVKGDQHFYANTMAPTIPAALTPVISGVAHLNTLQPRSFVHHAGQGAYDALVKRNVAIKAGNTPSPDLTLSNLYIVPGDAATIYDTPNSTFNANYPSSSTNYTGSGVTIGIGGDSAINTATIVDYRTRFLGDATTTNILNTPADTVTENGDAIEAYLDTEVSGGLAPGATIHFYPSSDLTTGIENALTENTVDIFSLSFGECEYYMTTTDNQYWYGLWQTAAAQGIAVTVSTGDSGSAGCDYPIDSNGDYVTAASGGLQVSGLASTPYNIAVGGTDFYALPGNFTTYAPATSSTSDYYRSATKYIPESTWNDSTITNGKLANDAPYTSGATIYSGSGGSSSCSTNSDYVSGQYIYLGDCASGYPKPVWQRGSGVPGDGVRDLPDVALMAGDGTDDAAWLICVDRTSTSGGVNITYNCTTQSNNDYYFYYVGGTSAASPAFAGILALVQQKAGGRLGQAAVELYDLYNGSHSSSIFHDITTGNNAVPCTSGSPNCSLNTAGNYFETGYDTTSGYDLATGLGSVDASNLVSYWGTGIGAATATVTVTPSSDSIVSSDTLTVSAVVAGSYTSPSGSTVIPTGTAILTTGSYTSSAVTLDSNGNASFTIPAGTITTAGDNTLTVSYSGDEFYTPATGKGAVTLLVPDITLGSSSLSFTAVLGTSVTQSVSVTSSGTAQLNISNVAVSGTNSSAFVDTSACGTTVVVGTVCAIKVTFTPTALGSTTAKLTITDNAPSATQTVSLSGTGTEPSGASYTINAAAVTISSAGGSGTSAVTATGSGGYVGPSTVTITGCTLATSPSGASDSPTCTVTAAAVTFASGASTGSGGVVTIGTTGPTSNVRKAALDASPWTTGTTAAAGIAVAGLLLFLPGRTRRWRALLGAFLLIASVGILSGCGGGGSGNPGTTTGTYTFTITGKDGAGTSQTATLTVTVN